MVENFIVDILKSKATIFSFQEAFLSSGEKKPHLLMRRLNYYVKKGILHKIRRGLYAKDKNYNKLELVTKIFTPSYISFETVLAQEGIIFQHYTTIFVATYQTREIVCDNQRYSFRKIKDAILTNIGGVENKEHYFIASKERAFLDTLYLNKDYHFDNLLPLDFDKILKLLPLYNNKRMEKQVKCYVKELNISEKKK